MNWKTLENETQLNSVTEFSFKKPQAIFKHSTRCSISTMVKSRLDKSVIDTIDFHYLDLIANRTISNLIAEKFNVNHESPQILLIKNGECIYDESHNGINIDELEEAL
jgi:bacillithiol system protein YtxJ